MAQAFSFALCSLRLALCKLVRCSEAIERNEAYESFSAACQEKIMVWSFRLDVKFWLFSLLVFVFDPLTYGMPRTDLLAAEIPAPNTITEGKTAQGFPYLAGGVSSNERENFVERGRHFNLKLSFADRRGPYIADVEVVIEAAKGGQIIRMEGEGPLFFIQLPDGNYVVKATFNREMKRVNVKLRKDKGVHYTLLWDLRDPIEGGGIR